MAVFEIDDPRWFAFVRGCPSATPFHHPAWSRLLADCYGYRAFAIVALDGAQQIIGGAPVVDVSSRIGGRRWISLPFTDYCPIVTPGESCDGLARAVVDQAVAGGGTLEFRAGLPGVSGLRVQASAVRHTLDLVADPDQLFRGCSKMHRRNIRKAEQSGLRVERGGSAADMATFYHLHLLTRRRLGVPIQPRRFFTLLARRVTERGLGFVLTAHVGDVPVAAAVFLAWNGTLVYKYGASDARYWEQRPNNLLFWTAIRWACEHGYHTLDWGRTDLDDHGLRGFKAGWGAKEEPLAYSVFSDVPQREPSGRLRARMTTIIRRSPPWVCQLIGELFYRYAA